MIHGLVNAAVHSTVLKTYCKVWQQSRLSLSSSAEFTELSRTHQSVWSFMSQEEMLPAQQCLMPPESHKVHTSGPCILKDLLSKKSLLYPFMNRKFVLSPAQVGRFGTSRNLVPAHWLSPSWTEGINAQNLFIPNRPHPGWGRRLPPSEKFHR